MRQVTRLNSEDPSSVGDELSTNVHWIALLLGLGLR